MELRGRTALITGSAKGLGKMTALTLAAMGCDIVLNYVNSEREAQLLAQEIEQRHGVRAVAVQADISRQEDVARLAATALAWSLTGSIDILINNAGPFIRERRLFADYEAAAITGLVNGNLLGVMLLDHQVLPGMRRRQWGRIIHFGFGHAGEGRAWPHRAVYAAAKTGLVSFTKTLAVEEAANGITVNMVCPGDIRGLNKERTIAEVCRRAGRRVAARASRQRRGCCPGHRVPLPAAVGLHDRQYRRRDGRFRSDQDVRSSRADQAIDERQKKASCPPGKTLSCSYRAKGQASLENLNNFLYAFDFLEQRAFDTRFQRDRRARAAAASTHQTKFNDAVFYVDEFNVAAVALQERAKLVEYVQYFVIHRVLVHFHSLQSTPFSPIIVQSEAIENGYQ